MLGAAELVLTGLAVLELTGGEVEEVEDCPVVPVGAAVELVVVEKMGAVVVRGALVILAAVLTPPTEIVKAV